MVPKTVPKVCSKGGPASGGRIGVVTMIVHDVTSSPVSGFFQRGVLTANKKPSSCSMRFFEGDRATSNRGRHAPPLNCDRHGVSTARHRGFLDCAGAADVAPSAPFYGPPPGYRQPPGYGPRRGYSLPDEYAPPSAYGPSPGYTLPGEDGPPPHAFGPPSYATPYAASPMRPACDLQWRCGPWGCGWRRVCYPEVYARPFRGYSPPPGPSYYGPY